MPYRILESFFFSRLLESGVQDEMDFTTRRSVRITNFIAMVGAVVSIVFAIVEVFLYTSGKNSAVVSLLANLALSLLLAFVPFFNARNHRNIANVYLLVIAYLQIIVFSWIAGAKIAVHFWLFIACAGTYLVFDTISSRQRLVIVLFSVAVFFFVDIFFTDDKALYPIAPDVLVFSRSLNLLMLFVTLVGVNSIFYRQTASAEKLLARELKRSEELLLNILPVPIAKRLKSGERSIAEHYDDVTVMFADLVGFTPLAATLPPDRVIKILDSVFSTFDEIVHIHSLEKIKTIGDCYMVVGGMPERVSEHTEAVAQAALDMQYELMRLNKITGFPLELRIGLHIGPVVAGVIGSKKFTYDLWGDTVNTASRMESHGEAGRIHCTEEVFQRLNHLFPFQERGEIDIKGKGMMKTYFLGA
ncbi:MAG: adenylate/guanylate cyclase domain-containing protein [Candidatus Kapabacteria bacterium]|jgi:class 3 adenylate cyclase|nr:adenylate/guanylate cyclase domain-containing protein [Candidatus Kapabacteria bacterium]